MSKIVILAIAAAYLASPLPPTNAEPNPIDRLEEISRQMHLHRAQLESLKQAYDDINVRYNLLRVQAEQLARKLRSEGMSATRPDQPTM